MLECMVARETVCVRQLAGGHRSIVVQFARFLANSKVTAERIIESWGDQTAKAAAGRHVLAIQDTSELNFRTSRERRRGLGEIGKGTGHGALLHAMLAVDADQGSCLGLVAGQVWTRNGRVEIPHRERPLAARESHRWLATGTAAKAVLAAAGMVTVVADRESDIYAEWATLPAPGFHLIARVMKDRRLSPSGTLYAAGEGFPVVDTATVELRERGSERAQRHATLALRFGPVTLRRPGHVERNLPASVALNLVEVVEQNPPAGAEPVHWRLLTTHEVDDAAAAWRIVEWYRMRWTIEQFFRVLKKQGLRLEDSQLDTADRLLKLTAIAAKAAVLTMQLVHARDGRSAEPAGVAFDDTERQVLEVLNARIEGKTELQKNPHPKDSLARAAWIIARLGGWDGYPSSRRPGPITYARGIEQFRTIATWWDLKNVCIP